MSNLPYDPGKETPGNVQEEVHDASATLAVVPSEGPFFREDLEVRLGDANGTELKFPTDFFFSAGHKSLSDDLGREVFTWIVLINPAPAVYIKYHSVGGDDNLTLDTTLLNQRDAAILHTDFDTLSRNDWSVLKGQAANFTTFNQEPGERVESLSNSIRVAIEALSASVSESAIPKAPPDFQHVVDTVNDLAASVGDYQTAISGQVDNIDAVVQSASGVVTGLSDRITGLRSIDLADVGTVSKSDAWNVAHARSTTLSTVQTNPGMYYIVEPQTLFNFASLNFSATPELVDYAENIYEDGQDISVYINNTLYSVPTTTANTTTSGVVAFTVTEADYLNITWPANATISLRMDSPVYISYGWSQDTGSDLVLPAERVKHWLENYVNPGDSIFIKLDSGEYELEMVGLSYSMNGFTSPPIEYVHVETTQSLFDEVVWDSSPLQIINQKTGSELVITEDVPEDAIYLLDSTSGKFKPASLPEEVNKRIAGSSLFDLADIILPVSSFNSLYMPFTHVGGLSCRNLANFNSVNSSISFDNDIILPGDFEIEIGRVTPAVVDHWANVLSFDNARVTVNGSGNNAIEFHFRNPLSNVLTVDMNTDAGVTTKVILKRTGLTYMLETVGAVSNSGTFVATSLTQHSLRAIGKDDSGIGGDDVFDGDIGDIKVWKGGDRNTGTLLVNHALDGEDGVTYKNLTGATEYDATGHNIAVTEICNTDVLSAGEFALDNSNVDPLQHTLRFNAGGPINYFDSMSIGDTLSLLYGDVMINSTVSARGFIDGAYQVSTTSGFAGLPKQGITVAIDPSNVTRSVPSGGGLVEYVPAFGGFSFKSKEDFLASLATENEQGVLVLNGSKQTIPWDETLSNWGGGTYDQSFTYLSCDDTNNESQKATSNEEGLATGRMVPLFAKAGTRLENLTFTAGEAAVNSDSVLNAVVNFKLWRNNSADRTELANFAVSVDDDVQVAFVGGSNQTTQVTGKLEGIGYEFTEDTWYGITFEGIPDGVGSPPDDASRVVTLKAFNVYIDGVK